jgi:hypothetical protein
MQKANNSNYHTEQKHCTESAKSNLCEFDKKLIKLFLLAVIVLEII